MKNTKNLNIILYIIIFEIFLINVSSGIFLYKKNLEFDQKYQNVKMIHSKSDEPKEEKREDLESAFEEGEVKLPDRNDQISEIIHKTFRERIEKMWIKLS